MTPLIFLDFDGTISDRDAIDAILERYASQEWLTIEEQWRRGLIGSRLCLTEQMRLVRASVCELDELLDAIQIDPGFVDLLEICAEKRVPVYIISDGFDYSINRILGRLELTERLRPKRIFASHLDPRSTPWQTAFPFFKQTCYHGCATCKPAVMKMLNTDDAPMIFVGDGLSDRYAAHTANVLFAKKSLAKYCAENEIKHINYETLRDVAGQFEQICDRLAYAPRNLIENTYKSIQPIVRS